MSSLARDFAVSREEVLRGERLVNRVRFWVTICLLLVTAGYFAIGRLRFLNATLIPAAAILLSLSHAATVARLLRCGRYGPNAALVSTAFDLLIVSVAVYFNDVSPGPRLPHDLLFCVYFPTIFLTIFRYAPAGSLVAGVTAAVFYLAAQALHWFSGTRWGETLGTVGPFAELARAALLFSSGAIAAYANSNFHSFIRRSREKEDVLEENRLRIESLGVNLPGVVFQLYLTDDQGLVVTYVSSAIKSILGVAPIAIIEDSRKVARFMEPDDIEAIRRYVIASVSNRTSWAHELPLRCADRALRWFRIIATPAFLSSGRVLTNGLLLDVQESREAQEALRRAKDEANRASQAKSDFLATMSHELRTPLSGIIGMTDLLLDTVLDFEQRECAITVRSSADALLSIINDILDLSRIESGRLRVDRKPFCLSAAIKTVADLLRPAARQKGLDLVISVGAGVPDHLVGDPGRLAQILLNLVANAIKFTQTGSVTLEVATDWVTDGALGLRCEVIDTGIGIDEKDREFIFGKFNQVDSGADRRFGGAGLGLTISRHLAFAMEGSITVESRPGRGSKFILRIPMSIEADPGCPDPDTRPTSTRNPRVLLVDDNEVNLRVQSRLLHRIGCRVDTAASGPEAIALAAATRYDIIFMDYQMPGMDGIETTRRLLADPESPSARAPILAITGCGMPAEKAAFLKAGMSEVLVKPVHKTDFEAVLRRWVGTESEDVLFDPLVAVDLIGEEPEDLHAALRAFIDKLRTSLAGIDEAFSRADRERLIRETHSLRGAALAVGANGFSRLVAGFERTALRSDDSSQGALKDAADRVVRDIQAYLQAVDSGTLRP